jgi:hypothetical protein
MSKGSRRRAACVSQEEVARNWLRVFCNHDLGDFEFVGTKWICSTCGAQFDEEAWDEERSLRMCAAREKKEGRR